MAVGSAPNPRRKSTATGRQSARTASRSVTARPSSRRPRRTVGLSRVERRRAIKARRARVGLVAALIVSITIVAAWFPASELMHQRQQLATATTQLDQLRQQDHALANEQKNLSSPSEIARIARDQYQLVAPGSTPYQVLPASDSTSNASGGQSRGYAGDPGLSKPVAPSGNVELPPGAGGKLSAAASSGGESSSFFGRILQTLEFWR